MSYFKPLNSNENNLHIIRATISGLGTVLNPSTNQLPANFYVSSLPSEDGLSTILTVNYDNVFNLTDTPSIFINTESSLNGNIYVTDRNNSHSNIYGDNIIQTDMPDIDLLIVGSRPTGPVFAVSNRGWKYATNLVGDNLIYSDMLVGINTDNPIFNLSHTGNIGFSASIYSTTSVIPSDLLENYMNIVNIDDSNVIVSMPGSIQDGQLVDITIGEVNVINRQLEIDITSNILNPFGTNLILKTPGDKVSLMGFNNEWLVISKQTTPLSTSVVNNYNLLYTSSINYSLLLNGYLNIISFDSTISANIDFPESSPYDGVYIDLVVGEKSPTNMAVINLLMGNIISSSDSIVLNNVSDRVKFIGTGGKWLLIQSHLS
jgi:hypothetical protein